VTVAVITNEAAVGGGEGPFPKQAETVADAGALAKQDKELAGNTGQHEHEAEQAAGPSSSTAHDAAIYLGMAV